jgi:serpin B
MKTLTALFALVLVSACTHKESKPAINESKIASQPPAEIHTRLPLTASESTFQLYRLRSEEPSNFVFSPLSLKLAFEILYPGASGENPKILENIFGLNSKTNFFKSESASVPEVKIANGLWMKDPKAAFPQYKEAVKNLGAEIGVLSAKAINEFVSSATHRKIEKLIDSIDPSSALIAVNALYFKADWKIPFEKSSTAPGRFQSSPHKTIVTQMMAKTARFLYAEDDTSLWVDLPYQSESMVMTLVLPKKRFDLKTVHEKLNASFLRTNLSKMKEEKVRLVLPKFKIEKKESMKGLLISAGYQKLFAADGWKKISSNPLNLADVLQGVVIQVDEKGTEAAAATAMLMTESSFNPMNLVIKDFICDQPFIFMLRNKKSGEIHFIGKLYEPETIKN